MNEVVIDRNLTQIWLIGIENFNYLAYFASNDPYKVRQVSCRVRNKLDGGMSQASPPEYPIHHVVKEPEGSLKTGHRLLYI